MDLLPSLECLGPLTHGRAPSLALDLMLGTRLIARGYANHTLKSRAQQLAEQHAAAWRARIDDPAAAAAAPLPRLREALAELVEAERLGQPHAALALALRRAVEATPPADFLGFDALRGPPPDVRVGAGWRLWARALLHAYTAQRAGVAWHPAVGVADVLGWLPRLRAHYWAPPPSPAASDGAAPAAPVSTLAEATRLAEQSYALTHVLLVLRDFAAPRVGAPLRALLAPERDAMLAALPALRAALGDAALDVTAELVDALKALGVADDAHPAVADASAFVRGARRADGSWGDGGLAYHTTIAALWALRDGEARWRWRGGGGDEARWGAEVGVAALGEVGQIS